MRRANNWCAAQTKFFCVHQPSAFPSGGGVLVVAACVSVVVMRCAVMWRGMMSWGWLRGEMKQCSWLWGDVRQCGWLRDVMWCHVKWSDVMSCHVVWSDVMSRDLMESDAKGWDVTFVMFCGWLWGHVMWCDVVVWCSELGDVQWTTERPWQQNPWDGHSGARWNPWMHNEIRLRRAHVTVLRLRTTNYYSLLKCNYDIGVTATSMLGGRHTWHIQYTAPSNL